MQSATVQESTSPSMHHHTSVVQLLFVQVATFTERTAEDLRAQLSDLKSRSLQLRISDPVALRSEARRLGDDVLQLERFVQLNQAAFVKIIKKHDKLNPDAPIWHLYVNHLQHQPWVHDGHTDLWSLVSGVFSDLHSGRTAVWMVAPHVGICPSASDAYSSVAGTRQRFSQHIMVSYVMVITTVATPDKQHIK